MKFRCQICNKFIEAEDVIAHDATHAAARFDDVLRRFHELPADDRLRLMERYCEICGWRLVDDACERDGCEETRDPEELSERPQEGGGPDQSPLGTSCGRRRCPRVRP